MTLARTPPARPIRFISPVSNFDPALSNPSFLPHPGGCGSQGGARRLLFSAAAWHDHATSVRYDGLGPHTASAGSRTAFPQKKRPRACGVLRRRARCNVVLVLCVAL